MYPVAPSNALRVDSTLELLEQFLNVNDRMTQIADRTDLFVLVADELHERLEGETFLDGFTPPTIADFAWHAALGNVLRSRETSLKDVSGPAVCAWYDRVSVVSKQTPSEHTQDTDTSDTSTDTSDTETKKCL